MSRLSLLMGETLERTVMLRIGFYVGEAGANNTSDPDKALRWFGRAVRLMQWYTRRMYTEGYQHGLHDAPLLAELQRRSKSKMN